MGNQINYVEGKVITASRTFENARVSMEDGLITAIEELDATPDHTLTWVPGFVDLHNHGGNRGAFPTGTYEDCVTAASYHRSQGTTTLLASMVSGTCDELSSQAEILGALTEAGYVAGIHMEGPFISQCKCGAQDPSRIVPGDPDFFAKVCEAAGGHMRSITFAPETANVEGLLEVCKKYNVIASLGHTEADFATTAQVIAQAMQLGVTVTATHLFNAMPQVHHREPGAVGALIAAAKRGEVSLELVADGVHLHDGTVDLAFNHKAFAITDAMEAAGMPDGQYRLGQLNVTVTDRVARVDSGAIAGGTSTLREQFMRFAARHNDQESVQFTSTTAAHVLGNDTIGDIAVGKKANLVGLTPNGAVEQVLVGATEL